MWEGKSLFLFHLDPVYGAGHAQPDAGALRPHLVHPRPQFPPGALGDSPSLAHVS